MRIARLDLIRYGKFTDRSVPLPHAQRDFHLIVGPNEAGKSTLRSAILDLLFGIETRSRFNFLHVYGDMRLGGLLEQGAEALDFMRVKAGTTKTLQDPAGTALSDLALAPFLGAVDRGFFDQMFGLDHARLVAGGQEILDASNDVGRILFQSAAGIGSFGAVRDALETEANALWAKRRSGEREYYIAADELEQAEAALKQATIRTKDWVAARDRVQRLEQDGAQAREQYRELEQTRQRLDRVRRVAPLLATLRDAEADLMALGSVVELPPEARQQFERAELAMVKAGQARQVFEEQIQGLETRIAEIHPDTALLARQADIQALSEQRQQLRNHPSDIGKRQEEVGAHWKALVGLIRQLGWAVADEAGLEARLPSELLRSATAKLIRSHDTLVQALAAAQEQRAAKLAEIQAMDNELAALPGLDASPTLKAALNAARDLGDVAAQDRRQAAQLARAERDLAHATLELGAWRLDLDALRRLQLPTQDELGALLRRQSELETAGSALAQRRADQEATLQELALEIVQYQAVHHPVSLADLAQVRGLRDALWQDLKTGARALDEAAPDYEVRVVDADALSDQRHDKASEASTYQAKLDQRERLTQQLGALQTREQDLAQARAAFDLEWDHRVAALGLPDMGLTQASAWRAARERVLIAAEALTVAREALDGLRDQADQARSALAGELRGLVPADQLSTLPLSALVLRAAELVDGAGRAQERRSALVAQRGHAQVALGEVERKLAQAEAALGTWQADWDQRLAALHLPPKTDTGSAEGALILFARMDDHLRQMRELRSARIDLMQRDLDKFSRDALALAQALAPELGPDVVGRPADEVARVLVQRLADTIEADKEQHRLQRDLEQARGQFAKALGCIQEAQAELESLLHQAGAADNEALRDAIARSDQARALGAKIGAARLALQDGSDGLPRELVEVECADADLTAIPADLAVLKAEVDAVVTRQSSIAAELNAAQNDLDRIAGQDAAAQAEGRRQEALARMANAAERYVKVHTAARLLRWAIERYREQKQGPLLSRAGDIFAALTLGSFVRLAVDYERDPPTLYGQRPGGERVGVEGLSDGSRDQLYLALRLAALELHLEQAQAMPFIADDLVVNYDDARARAGLEALAELSERTQVIFLSHHEHLVPVAEAVFGVGLNVVRMGEGIA